MTYRATIRGRAGLTLIELMATMAIVSILTVSALAVLNRLPTISSGARQQQERSSFRDSLRDLITDDLFHATQYCLTGGGFVLKSHMHLDQSDMDRTFRPGTITYLVQRVGDSNCLVRVQKPDRGEEVFTELVCPDVKSVTLESVEKPLFKPIALQPMPAGVAVIVEFEKKDAETLVIPFSKG